MSPEQAQTVRKRRAHKRSRNGCLVCKQRHIRCDELRPVCTNCLTRGGKCTYPEPARHESAGNSGPGSGISESESPGIPILLRGRATSDLGIGGAHGGHGGLSPGSHHGGGYMGGGYYQVAHFPTSPGAGDVFDVLPVKMPLRSMELWAHFNNYRIFSRAPVAKKPGSASIAIALATPGTFRACLIMTSLHYALMYGKDSLRHTSIVETCLYHKLEAIKDINEMIADPEQRTSDACLLLIAGLALAESGMGGYDAAEAHLNGLYTLINMRCPEEWQHRIWGILQRIILMIGSFIAAGKRPSPETIRQFKADEASHASPQNPQAVKPTSPLFSIAPFSATRLSPSYAGSTPCLEACNADLELEVLLVALRRLSSRDALSPQRTPTNHQDEDYFNFEDGILARDATAILLSDADSFIASLLFKTAPSSNIRSQSAEHGRKTRAGSRNLGASSPRPLSKAATSPLPTTSSPLLFPSSPYPSSPYPMSPTTERGRSPALSIRDSTPFSRLPATLFPSSDRTGWTAAAYLYLHVILAPLWGYRSAGGQPSRRQGSLDPHLVRLLLDVLLKDIEHTAEAMRIGAYSSDLWIWKVMVTRLVLNRISTNSSKTKDGLVVMGSATGDVVVDIDDGGIGGITTTMQNLQYDQGAQEYYRGESDDLDLDEGTVGDDDKNIYYSPPSGAGEDDSEGGREGRALLKRKNAKSKQPLLLSLQSTTTANYNQITINLRPDPPSRPRSRRPSQQPPASPSPGLTTPPYATRVESSSSATQEKEGKHYVASARNFLDEQIRTWSGVSGVFAWDMARERLGKIAWPMTTDVEGLFGEVVFEKEAREIWIDAVIRRNTTTTTTISTEEGGGGEDEESEDDEEEEGSDESDDDDDDNA